MSSRWWASSEDLSVDSMSEDVTGYPRDKPSKKARRTEDTRDSEDGPIETIARTSDRDIAQSSLQPHTHATLFYLALIEGRCKTKAAKTLELPENHPDVCCLADQLFVEAKSVLIKAGMIPEEFARRPLPMLPDYLGHFDTILENIATRRSSDTSALQDKALEDSLSLTLAANVPHWASPSAGSLALMPFMTGNQGDYRFVVRKSPLLSMLLPEASATNVPESIFTTEYNKISRLGKGGFGSVYLAEYHVDKRKYAIKRVIIRAKTLNQYRDALQVLLSEVHGLARLDHHNVVRYYHCWLESRPATFTSIDSDSGSEDTDSGAEPEIINDNVTGAYSIGHDFTRQMKHDFGQNRASFSVEELEASMDYIGFEDSGSHAAKTTAGMGWDSAQAASASDIASPQHTGNIVDVKEEWEDNRETASTEEVSRSQLAVQRKIDEDLHVYIKMAEYPLSLEDYLSPEKRQSIGTINIKHCFHVLPTIRILFGILTGVEYIHRQGMIHRDLKPANILLSVLPSSEPATPEYINTARCKDCTRKRLDAPTHICPRIGDFGLIHDLGAPPPSPIPVLDEPLSPSKKQLLSQPFQSSPSIMPQIPIQQPGTMLYLPLTTPKDGPAICEKLDVYSLGIIAFEMLYIFGTKTERIMVLNDLKRGIYPSDFEACGLADGIRGMVCEERDERWDCARVRRWLVEKLGECE